MQPKLLGHERVRRHPERSRSSGGGKDLACVDALRGRGCPILARSLRKGGPLCSLHKGILSVLALTLTMATSACRIDMHVQPRQNPLSHSDFYPDQRSERPPVEGTVARGQLREDA